MMYRLTKRVFGGYKDIVEDGETFDYESKTAILSTLDAIGWKNGHGEKLNFREVSEGELVEELQNHAAYRAEIEME